MNPSEIAAAIKAPPAQVAIILPLLEKSLAREGIGSVWTEVAAIATINVECPPWKPIQEYSPKGMDRATYFENMYGPGTPRGIRLGNTEPGDGLRFCGHGLIQLTGRSNFTRAGKYLGKDLVGHPELALVPEVACDIFAWFFRENKVHLAADNLQWKRVRRIVNGGENGLSDFLRAVAAVLRTQGLSTLDP